ncbi:MAG: ATP-binding protein [Cyclobacteriaceae bacterium]
MDLQTAKIFISKGENGFVEFKKKANHPEKIIREVVAFSNSEGGHLFVGVDDDGTISGLKYPEEDEFILNKAIAELCRPKVDYEVELLKFHTGRSILHYEIKEGLKKPTYAFLNKKHRYGKAFIRLQDRSIQASYEMRKFLSRKETTESLISFEESTTQLFKFFEENSAITLSQYRQLFGLNKKLASSKLVSLALSGALKIEPREGEDLFVPVQ